MAMPPRFAAKKAAPKSAKESPAQVRKEIAFLKKGGAPKGMVAKELKEAKRK